MIPWFQYTSMNLGFLKIHIWGLLISLSFIVSMIVAYLEFKKKKLETTIIFDLAFWLILAAVIGGRLFYIFEHFIYFLKQPFDIFKLWLGGMSIYGGFLGAFLAGWLYLRKNKLDFWQYANAVFFVLPLGIFIGRLGCFFIHDHPGIETNFFLGVAYPDGVRHDLGLYLSLNGLALFILFLILHRRKWFSGFYFSIFAVWYGVVRFLLDFLRTKDVVLGMAPDPRYFGLTLAQYLSIILFVVGVYLFYKFKTKNKKLKATG